MKPDDLKSNSFLVEILRQRNQQLSELPLLRIRGIYFLFLGEELQYIGQSTDLYMRIPGHRGKKEFDRVFFFEWDGDLDSVECELIKNFDPPLNKSFVFNKKVRDSHARARAERAIWSFLTTRGWYLSEAIPITEAFLTELTNLPPRPGS